MKNNIKDLPKPLGRSRERKKDSPNVYVFSPVWACCLGSVRTGSATAAFCRASGAGKTAFTRRDGHSVGDGDALPGGREGGRDAGMQEREEGARPTNNINWRGSDNGPIICIPIQCSLLTSKISIRPYCVLPVFTDITKVLCFFPPKNGAVSDFHRLVCW